MTSPFSRADSEAIRSGTKTRFSEPIFLMERYSIISIQESVHECRGLVTNFEAKTNSGVSVRFRALHNVGDRIPLDGGGEVEVVSVTAKRCMHVTEQEALEEGYKCQYWHGDDGERHLWWLAVDSMGSAWNKKHGDRYPWQSSWMFSYGVRMIT